MSVYQTVGAQYLHLKIKDASKNSLPKIFLVEIESHMMRL